MRIVEGKTLAPAAADDLARLRAGYDHCLVDVGTGDGLFPYRWAREHPEDLAVGVDAVGDALVKLATKARRKPAKGGAPNLLLAVAAAETLPGPLAGWADEVTVNYPWGSLLRDLVAPEPALLRRLAALCRPGARFTALLNSSVFNDSDYRDRLALPPLTEERARKELVPAYAASGIRLDLVRGLAGEPSHRTTWGQRLVRGSGRNTLHLAGSVEL